MSPTTGTWIVRGGATRVPGGAAHLLVTVAGGIPRTACGRRGDHRETLPLLPSATPPASACRTCLAAASPGVRRVEALPASRGMVWSLPGSDLEVLWPGPGAGLRIGWPRRAGGATTTIDHPAAAGRFDDPGDAEAAVRAFAMASGTR